jgi:hypothetical protein
MVCPLHGEGAACSALRELQLTGIDHMMEVQRVMTILGKAKWVLTNFKNSIGHTERILSSPNDESKNLIP